MNAVTTGILWADSTRARQCRAFMSALGIEVAVVALFIAWMVAKPPALPDQVIPLSIESLSTPLPETFPQPEKPSEPQKKTPVASPLPQPSKPAAPAAMQPEVATVPVPEPLQNTQPAAPATATAALAPAAPPQVISPPSPPVQQVTDPTPAYNAKLTAAAQAAFEVPGTVTALNFKGRARIGFKLRDGVVSSISLVQSSGLGAMDRAAMKAVQTALFPPPPPGFQGKEISYGIWVTHTPSN